MSEIRVDVIKDELGTGAPEFPNGNVGIGKSNPAGRLHIDTASTTNRALVVESSTGWGNIFTPMVEISTNSDGKVFKATAATNRSDMNMFEIANANGNVLAIRGTGAVTMPYQPMFLGRPSVDYSSGGMPNAIIAFTSIHNNGSHFNAANSRFTAPVTGWYLTTWGGLQLAASVTSLMKNGVRLHQGNHYNVATPTYITMTQTAIEYLNAGDYLNVEGWNGGGYYSSWYLWSVTLLG